MSDQENRTSQPTSASQRIRANWQSILNQVADAARKSSRDPDEIRIIGVSKYVDLETTEILNQVGCCDLGESRPQSLWQKAEAGSFSPDVIWHMIGHVQTNKIRRLLRHRIVIHSVDSDRVLQKIIEEAKGVGRTVDILLEINISGDQSKTGMTEDDVKRLLDVWQVNRSENVNVIGLMAMAGRTAEPSESQKQFAEVRKLRDELQQTTEIRLPELSMGMSGDFSEAIAEGATMVRIGSALFEGVPF